MGGRKIYVKKTKDKALPYSVIFEGKVMKKFENHFDADYYEGELRAKYNYFKTEKFTQPKPKKIDANERKNLEYAYPKATRNKSHKLWSGITKGLTSKGTLRKKGKGL